VFGAIVEVLDGGAGADIESRGERKVLVGRRRKEYGLFVDDAC